VAELLEPAHLVDEHRVAEMEVRRGGIESSLDTQRLAAAELLLQFLFGQDFGDAAFEFGELFVGR